MEPQMPRSISCPESKGKIIESPKKSGFALTRWNSRKIQSENKEKSGKSDSNETALLPRHPSLPLKVSFQNLPLAKDVLSEYTMNKHWKNQLKIRPVKLEMAIPLKDVLRFIDNYCCLKIDRSCLPLIKKDDLSIFDDFSNPGHCDQGFLVPLRLEFTQARDEFESYFAILHHKTKESVIFYEHLNSLIRLGDFSIFMTNIKKFAADGKSNFPLFLQHFKLDAHFIIELDAHYQSYRKSLFDTIENLKTLYTLLPKVIGQNSRWETDFNADSIKDYNKEQVRRCFQVGSKIILTNFKINHLKPIVVENSYLQGVIHRIYSAGFDLTATDATARNDRIAFENNAEISCGAILRLCSTQNWAKADSLIREKLKALFEIPVTTICAAEGMQCRVSITSAHAYCVRQRRSYDTFYRLFPDDKDRFVHEKEPMGTTTFEWKVTLTEKGYKARVSIKRWEINQKAPLENQFKYLQLLSRCAA